MKIHFIICSMLVVFFSCDNGSLGPQGKLTDEIIGQLAPESQKSHAAKNIIAGYAHVCAHLDNDRIKCWGRNEEGQCNPKSARNARGLIYDISNAQFSKLTASSGYTCGIVKNPPYSNIPFCFGKEGSWLDVPHEPVKDISAYNSVTCFIKEDGRLGCVGDEIIALFNNVANPGGRAIEKTIKAPDLIKHGIDPFSKQINQDFSQKKFNSVKVGERRVCAQGVDDGIVYCMGQNLHGGGESLPHEVLDYHVDITGTDLHFIEKNGSLIYVGINWHVALVNNIPDQYTLKYKRFLSTSNALVLLTAAGNSYLDGKKMPENTAITFGGFSEENVKEGVMVTSSFKIGRFPIFCMVKDNHKIKCISTKDTDTPIIKDIPPEIAYVQ